MEKQRSKSISKSCRRLLIILSLFAVITPDIFSQTLTNSEINQLRISPAEDQQLFTKTDIRFEVLIPKVKPSQVQILSSNLPANVSFKTSRKQEDFENNGTKIELWYNFEKRGSYQLPPLPITIQNRRRSLKYSPITVNDDPAKQSPQLYVVFSNGARCSSKDEANKKPLYNAKVNQKQTLTVFVQYVSQVVQFSWDIPKDSIFSQTKSYDITEVKYREKNYTHDLIPVATFEWTGLKTGILPMIKFKTVVTGYNGYRSELYLPEAYINFIASSSDYSSNEDQMFNDAFNAGQENDSSIQQKTISVENCEQLAKYYSEERNAIYHFSQKHKDRTEYETSLGLPSTTQADFTMGFLHISIAVSILLFIFLLILIKKKNLLPVLFISTIFISSLVPMVNLFMKRNDLYAICKGCTLHSVPEEKSEALSEIGAGNRVHITEKAGKWVYIEFGETVGWGLKDNVIFIK